MIRDFGIVWSERDLLLSGLGNTTILSVLSAIAGLLIAFLLTPLACWALLARTKVLGWAFAAVFDLEVDDGEDTGPADRVEDGVEDDVDHAHLFELRPDLADHRAAPERHRHLGAILI